MSDPDIPSRLTQIARAFSSGAGDEEPSASIHRGYLQQLGSASRVLDVGCGSGAFLDLLRDRGVQGVGIECSDATAEAALARGHRIEIGDAEQVLTRLADAGERFDGALVSQVIEHMEPGGVLRLLDALLLVLEPGARVVVSTPNPRNLIVLSEVFWLDPTHVRPYPRALIEELGREVGLRVVASYDDPASRPRRSPWKQCLAVLRSKWSGADRAGPMDSVVVFER